MTAATDGREPPVFCQFVITLLTVQAPNKATASLQTRVNVSWAGAVPPASTIDALFTVLVPPAVETWVVDGVTLQKSVQLAQDTGRTEESVLLGFIMDVV